MKIRLIASLAILSFVALPAFADSYSVNVGYADGLRGAGFFPSPWFGDPNVVFVGTPPSSGAPDAGAIMITNTSGSSITVNDISVNIGGNIFDLWGSNTLLAGQSLIVTQTSFYNFDSSDFSGSSCGVNNGVLPTVTATVDGVATTFTDSGQVLNTSGYDFACQGNESFAWRPIGTFGGPSGTPTPEPGSLALLAAGMLLVGLKYATRSIA